MLDYQKNVLFKNEHFTVLLRAAFHPNEELVNRRDPTNVPPSDMAHLGATTILMSLLRKSPDKVGTPLELKNPANRDCIQDMG
jgi:hypothetical protein